MDVLIVGAGVVGAGVVDRLANTPSIPVGRVAVVDRNPDRAWQLAEQYGSPVTVGSLDDSADVVVLATASGSQARLARRFLARGRAMLSTSDSVADVRRLLGMHGAAQRQNTLVVAGVGMAPGLSDVLAGRAAEGFDRVTEVHVAKFGTGGPACARQHHKALSSLALEWRGGWKQRPGGSGRELCWFPSPVDAADCYRAALPDPMLLVRKFSGADRITARMAATRRDRFSSWLPMLRPPHPEGKLGAVRVEVRGQKGQKWTGRILGASAPPGTATAAVVMGTIELFAGGQLRHVGAMGLSEVVDTAEFLDAVEGQKVVCEEFAGA
ncbi:saccharopine dehydrogenase NADP-binding domain-containing protein [Candidatus Poriferisocius sp.]|uniref:saccharopine dehydrogenase NADP-binding domain-containing protein n=1 Tax=Candidatus Poriferisocius sp. TaxID=3101276 RepID=UPI003B014FFA